MSRNRFKKKQFVNEPEVAVETPVTVVPKPPLPVEKVVAPKAEPKPETKSDEWQGAHLGDKYICINKCTYAGKLWQEGEEFLARDHEIIPHHFLNAASKEAKDREEMLEGLRKQIAQEEAMADLERFKGGY